MQDNNLPAKPTGLTAYPSSRSVHLTWADPSDRSITGWQYRQGSGQWTDISDSNAKTTSHTVGSLTDNRSYRLQVRAVDTGGVGPASDAVTVRPNPPQPQTVQPDWAYIPTGLGEGDSFRVLFVSAATIDTREGSLAEFNAHVQKETNANPALGAFKEQFRAIVSTADTDARDNIGATPADGSAYADGEGVPIWWIGGVRAAADYSAFFSDSKWESAADEVRFSDGTKTTARLFITGSKHDGTRHDNYVGRDAGIVLGAHDNGAGVRPIQWQVVTSTQGRQRAQIYGISPVLTVVDTQRPVAPEGLTAVGGFNYVTLRWTASTDTSIRKWQYRQGSGAWTDIADSSHGTAAHTVGGLATGRSYTFRVRAVDGVGVGATSGTVTARTAAPQAQTVEPNWKYVPANLKHGDSFRLLFVTSTVGYALPTAVIGDSDRIVQERAGANTELAGFSGHFRALISTATVDARDNTATGPAGASYASGEGEAIYWLGGAKAADDYADLYDGSWDSTDWKTEQGNQTTTGTSFSREVWTGSDADGTRHAANYAGATQVRYGWLGNNMPVSQNVSGLRTSGNGLAYYGLSPVINVVDTIVPKQTTGLRAFAGDRTVVLDWSDPDDRSVTGYQYRQDGGAWQDIPGSGPATARHTVRGLINDTAYTFEVRAVDAAGDGLASAEVTETPLGQQPILPQTVAPDSPLIPDELNPTGHSFRLLFVTSTKRDATSPHILDYNLFVQEAARNKLALPALAPFADQFRAIISTETVDAADNVEAHLRDGGVPIFWVNGDMVAPNYFFFYGKAVKKVGSEWTYKPLWRSRAATDESGDAMPNTDPNDWVWTGSNDDGTKHPTNHAGNSAGSGVMAASPLAHDPLSHIELASNQEHRLYALSPVITVATAVTVTPTGVDRLTVSWDPGTYTDGFYYRVQWRSGSEPWDGNRARTFQNDTTSAEIDGLKSGTVYEVRVSAINDDDSSIETVLGYAQGTTLGTPAPLPQVTGVNAAPKERAITVTWYPIVGVDSYKVQWKSGSESFSDARQGTLLAGGILPRYEITNLEVATEYTLRVIAVKSDRPDGPPSDEVTARAAGMTATRTANGLMLTFAAPSKVVDVYDLKWTLLNQTAAERARPGDQDTGRHIHINGDQNGYEITGLQSGRLYKVEMWWRPYVEYDPIPLGEVGSIRPGP
ncbi:MAG: fibronectin type III domain-containing protein [Chloroflexi bacterium]|nr:fibronectin type III domain-containing protein [Chloroflexota bacterium]